MWTRPSAIECEPTDALKATLAHERAKPDADPQLIKAIVHVLARRALGMDDENGFPRALRDEQDEFQF